MIARTPHGPPNSYLQMVVSEPMVSSARHSLDVAVKQLVLLPALVRRGPSIAIAIRPSSSLAKPVSLVDLDGRHGEEASRGSPTGRTIYGASNSYSGTFGEGRAVPIDWR